MSRDLAWRRSFVRAYDPHRVLTPQECAVLYVGREGQPAARIVEALEEEEHRCRIVLVGARGSGKSTELRQVVLDLSRDSAVMVPILIDINEGLPENATTAAWLPVVAAAVRAAREDWGGAVPGGLPLEQALGRLSISADLFEKLTGIVRTIGPWFGPGGLAAAGGAAVLGEAAEQLGSAARAAQDAKPDRRELEGVIQAMRRELASLERAAGRGVALLLDGLDRRPTADAIFLALSEADLLETLPAALVLSGPMHLQVDGRFAAYLTPGRFQPYTVHNLPVVAQDGTPKEIGVGLLLRLYERRWSEARLGEPILTEEIVRAAARWSSGIVREFLTLLRDTVKATLREGRAQATMDDLLSVAVRERRHTMEITLDSSAWGVLAEVLESRERPPRSHDTLLFHNAVVCYQNDNIWYRPNEFLIPYLQSRTIEDG